MQERKDGIEMPGPPESESAVPFDVTVPNAARMYDYALGGKDHFAADREAADKVLAISPDAKTAAWDNRAFLHRAVQHAIAGGVTQFIDIGAGLPTVQNTHQIAQAACPRARVMYVDYDTLVVAHANALLAGGENVCVFPADLRKPEQVLACARQSELIDLGQPVAILLVAVLHFIGEDSYQIVGTLKQAMAPSSCLVISHATPDGAGDQEAREVQSVYDSASASLSLRRKDEIARFFDGMTLSEPGIVSVSEWHNRPLRPSRVLCYGGVAWKSSPPPQGNATMTATASPAVNGSRSDTRPASYAT